MMTSTHSFGYIHIDCSKSVPLKINNSKFHIFFIFHPIYIRFSWFCSKCFTLCIQLTFNLDWISPLKALESLDQPSSLIRIIFSCYHRNIERCNFVIQKWVYKSFCGLIIILKICIQIISQIQKF